MTKKPELFLERARGKIVLITGANSGIGFEAAKALASAGATVFLACRSEPKGQAAKAKILATNPKASVELRLVDLSDLKSIETFATTFTSSVKALDVLINNAGVMALPLSRTAQGFEMQFGVNHLGHFVLTGHLMNLLRDTPGSRIVNVASLAHRFGRIRWDDPNWQRAYARWPAYGQSKLANLLFTRGLNYFGTRDPDGPPGPVAVSCHPGYASTNLTSGASQNPIMKAVYRMSDGVIAQTAEQGAWPTLRAACDTVSRNDYFGPAGALELAGVPVKVTESNRASSDEAAQRLWRISEQLTGVAYFATE